VITAHRRGKQVRVRNISINVSNDYPLWSGNSTNSTLAGVGIEHRVKWTDNSELSGYIFSFCNGSWTAQTAWRTQNETVERTGSVGDYNSPDNSGNTTLIVPDDAELMIVSAHGWRRQ